MGLIKRNRCRAKSLCHIRMTSDTQGITHGSAVSRMAAASAAASAAALARVAAQMGSRRGAMAIGAGPSGGMAGGVAFGVAFTRAFGGGFRAIGAELWANRTCHTGGLRAAGRRAVRMRVSGAVRTATHRALSTSLGLRASALGLDAPPPPPPPQYDGGASSPAAPRAESGAARFKTRTRGGLFPFGKRSGERNG